MISTNDKEALKPVDIIHEDGYQETIYVKPKGTKDNIIEKLPIVLSLVMITALIIGIYINYLHLKNIKSNGS